MVTPSGYPGNMNGHNSKNRPKRRRRASWATRGAEAGIRKGPREDRAGVRGSLAGREEQPLSLAGAGTGGRVADRLAVDLRVGHLHVYGDGRPVRHNARRHARLRCARGVAVRAARPEEGPATIGGKKQLLVALREVGRPTCRR
jgi:hypothetical protein